MVDPRKRLLKACRQAQTYPKNLRRSKTFPQTLERYNDQLKEVEDRLFDPNPTHTVAYVLQARDAGDDFLSATCNSLEALTAQFETDKSDPVCQFIFLEADHSRAPLDCSIEMFTYVMSYFQIMAPFLDLAFGFGKQWAREDFYYTTFRPEYDLNPLEADEYAIPQLGRSGREYRQCYNLWSVERSNAGGLPWSIRQTAFYHSFDVETGHALWVNISPNDQVNSRITKAAPSHLSPGTACFGELYKFKLFAATLTTHLIVFEWGVENWRGYISSLDTAARDTLDTVNNLPVEDVEQVLTAGSGGLITPPNIASRAAASRANSSPKYQQLPPKSTATTATTSSPRKRTFDGFNFTRAASSQAQSPVSIPVEQPDQDPLRVLNNLSFNSIQRLNRILGLLYTAQLVMGLNKDILSEQMQYYEGLLSNQELPEEFRAGCAIHVADFCRRVKSQVRLLAMEQARVDTLILLLSNGRDSFDKLLQLRNIATGKLLALQGHHLAVDMHQIAAEAKRETKSMHIITFVTLIFLPATFVATFLGSGLFQWDDDTNTSDPFPVWRPQFFALFAQISFPLTSGTVLVWLLAFSWPRLAPWVRGRRWRARCGDEEDPRGEKDISAG